jgi:hypothetical protein
VLSHRGGERKGRRGEDLFFDCSVRILNCVGVFESDGIRDATVPQDSDGGGVLA